MSIKNKIFSFILMLLLLQTTGLHADADPRIPPTEHDVQAAYLYNFLRFVRWPETTFLDSLEPVIIGIVGESPIASRLEKLASERTLHSHPLIVKHFEKNDNNYKCHVLYIGSIEKRYQISILKKLKKTSVLTLSDSNYFCDIGGMINFMVVEDRVAFRVNLKALKKANLDISAKILRLASSILK